MIVGNASFMVPVLIIGVLGLWSVVGTVVVPITAVSQADRTTPPAESVDRRLSVHLDCPRCGLRQRVAGGPSRCRGCRAGLLLEVEEPRCVCGYLLYRLEGRSCPECGEPVPPRTMPA